MTIIVWLWKLVCKFQSLHDETTAYNKALKQWITVASEWRKQYLHLAKEWISKTGVGLNLGLIYSGDLKNNENYGAGVPLFWSSDYWQSDHSNDEMIAGNLIVCDSESAKIHSVICIKDFHKITEELLETPPAQYIENKLALRNKS